MSPGSVWAVLQSSSVPALRAQLKTAELCPLVALPNTEPHTERSCEEAACCSPMSLWSHKPWNKTSCWHFNIFLCCLLCILHTTGIYAINLLAVLTWLKEWNSPERHWPAPRQTAADFTAAHQGDRFSLVQPRAVAFLQLTSRFAAGNLVCQTICY